MTFTWNCVAQCGNARAGIADTSVHGSFVTPAFMPVGTRASVRGIDSPRLKECGAQIVLVNTYHLMLRPGATNILNLGSIHRFMGWDGPILSDSGGFQVFSLKSLRSISEEGVHFRSHLDGSKQFLSPEKAVALQETYGVDIAMVLDECPPSGVSKEEMVSSIERTHRWALRCHKARTQEEKTSLFGITQGGRFLDLRTESAERLKEIPFDGYAIGGVSVGEPKEVMYQVLSMHPQELPKERVRYLMGVGTPRDIVEGVRCGIDMFDCVMPTRAGRFGRAFVLGDEPYLNIRNARFASDMEALDPTCSCVTCSTYGRAYLHHLFKAGEMLGPTLLSLHNISYYQRLVKELREDIVSGCFEQRYLSEDRRWKNTKNNDVS